MTEQRYFMVRAMSQTPDDFAVFFQNDKEVVAVGWSEVNFSASAPESIVAQVYKTYYADGHVAPQVVGKKKNEVRRFKELKEGDRILIPHWGNVRIAVATGQERFSPKDGGARDLANQHIVRFVRSQTGDFISFPRSDLSEGLQRRLRVRGTTIANLAEFTEEIEKLFSGETYKFSIGRAVEQQKSDFIRHLVILLQDGTSALEAGGTGLEKLVKELLEADGYVASIQSKRRFLELADADIEAVRDDHITSVKLLVQVKHHAGITGIWGAEQLSNILEKQADLFLEYQLVLVTTAAASEDLQHFCEDKDITLITGQELAEWIADDWHHLSKDTLRRLKLGDVPQIVTGQPTTP